MAAALSLTAAGIDCVLLDIEGTTTPIAFVHDVLFPYARARVRSYLETTTPADAEIQAIIEDLRRECSASDFTLAAVTDEPPPGGPPVASRHPRAADIAGYVYWLMDRDRKSGPLKALQGRIWQEGYATGGLHGEVYSDVPGAFMRWTTGGHRIGIFSSGSVLSQRLLFAHSIAGDLSPFLSSYFDTGVGAKADPESYQRIVLALGAASSRIIFVSDIVSELDAARAAGLRTLLCVRPPARAPSSSAHDIVESFDAIAT